MSYALCSMPQSLIELTMKKKDIVTMLLKRYGGRYSTELGIDISVRKPNEIFKWFLASVLFGARISESIVMKTYREFEGQGILSPEAILKTGWDGLVQVLDRGGYVRYDFKTATKLLDMSKALMDKYAGSLNTLHASASNPEDLEEKLKSLAKGIGDVTVNIFLRELRGIWEKADPLPLDLVTKAARHNGIIFANIDDKKKVLTLLKQTWKDAGMRGKDFSDFEAALIRAGKELRRSKMPV